MNGGYVSGVQGVLPAPPLVPTFLASAALGQHSQTSLGNQILPLP